MRRPRGTRRPRSRSGRVRTAPKRAPPPRPLPPPNPLPCRFDALHPCNKMLTILREALLKRFPGLFLILCSAASLCAQEGPFGAGLYQVMEKAACRSCHNPDGVASPTRLQFPEPDAAPDKLEAFG